MVNLTEDEIIAGLTHRRNALHQRMQTCKRTAESQLKNITQDNAMSSSKLFEECAELVGSMWDVTRQIDEIKAARDKAMAAQGERANAKQAAAEQARIDARDPGIREGP